MKRARSRLSNYPGNEWLESAFARLGVEASVPFAHGVLRGTLVNPAKADPGRAFFQILRTKTPLDQRPAEVDSVIEGLFCLGDDIVKSYLFDQELPEAVRQGEAGGADALALCGRIIDLTDGFYVGLAAAPIPRACRIESCDAWVGRIVKDARTCAKWFEKPRKFEARCPDPGQRMSAVGERLARIEENMLLLGRHVARTVRGTGDDAVGTAAPEDDDCPICSATDGPSIRGMGRMRGAFLRH